MATGLINGEFEKLRAHVESVKMSEEKNSFFRMSGIAFVRKRRKRKISKQYYQLNGRH